MRNKHLRLFVLSIYAALAGALITPAPSAAQTAVAEVEPPGGPQLLPVYRFWSQHQGNAHFYTMDEQEKNAILRFDNADSGGNWKYEGIGYQAYPALEGSCGETRVSVLRYWSARFQSHFYTSNAQEIAALGSDANWQYEQLAYCADSTQVSGSTPLYRFWSPTFGKHFFTASAGERAALANDANWRYEGVSNYVYPT